MRSRGRDGAHGPGQRNRGGASSSSGRRDRAGRGAALLLAVLAALACGAGDGLRLVTQDEAVAALSSDAPPLFLDVRSPAEFAAGHLPGALLVPHTEIGARLDEVLARRERLVVVYCERGPRAEKAAESLRRAGLEHLALLDGHMSAWRERGLPIEAAGTPAP